MNKEIITCTGYGTTGSSAATNVIEEFENVKTLNSEFECTFLHEADGIRDLENALREGHRLKTDMSIKRFLRLVNILNKQTAYKKYFNNNFEKHSINYINSICTAQWNGNWHRSADTIKIPKTDLLYFNLAKQIFLNEYSYSKYSLYEPFGWKPAYQMRNKSYYAVFDDSFYFKTRKYIDNLFTEIFNRTNANKILIDQFFPAYDISAYLNYAPNTKIIIVDKDPRDMYVLNKSFWAEPYIPTDDVDTFINWYKGIRFSQKQQVENKNVLFIKFEDLIFKYEESIQKIKLFLNFDDKDHVHKKKKFDPAKSIKNTNKFKCFPQWNNDILKIEKDLSEYCYDFYDNGDIQINTDKPIEKYMQDVYKIQIEKKLPAQYENKVHRLLFGMTGFGEVCESMLYRKTLKAKLKGIIKSVIFFMFFLFEYPLLKILYLKYKINK